MALPRKGFDDYMGTCYENLRDMIDAYSEFLGDEWAEDEHSKQVLMDDCSFVDDLINHFEDMSCKYWVGYDNDVGDNIIVIRLKTSFISGDGEDLIKFSNLARDTIYFGFKADTLSLDEGYVIIDFVFRGIWNRII